MEHGAPRESLEPGTSIIALATVYRLVLLVFFIGPDLRLARKEFLHIFLLIFFEPQNYGIRICADRADKLKSRRCEGCKRCLSTRTINSPASAPALRLPLASLSNARQKLATAPNCQKCAANAAKNDRL